MDFTIHCEHLIKENAEEEDLQTPLINPRERNAKNNGPKLGLHRNVAVSEESKSYESDSENPDMTPKDKSKSKKIKLPQRR